MNLPEQFMIKMQYLLKEEYEAYKNSFNEKRLYGLRTNPLKISADKLYEKNLWDLEPVPWCKEGFYYPQTQRPSKHPYYYAGLFYLQEPSAMAPAAFLPIDKGEKILDLCAAPGGKSTQLGAKLAGKGILIANDISAARTKALLKNIELFGITNAVVMSEAPEKLVSRFPGYFDKIIVDAPCSGEGMFRKEPDVAKNWGKEMTVFCLEQQKSILENAAKLLRTGGMILYSTCTFAPEENEGTIENFLKEHENFELIPLSKGKGFEDGKPQWIENGRQELTGCIRLFPHKIKGEGHFLALLQKKKGEERNTFQYEKEDSDERITTFLEFKNKNLSLELNGIFKIYQDNLYLLPKETPILKGLRVIRSGWHLGVFKKNRFEPSQAFAMGLKKEQANLVVDLPLEDETVVRYLKGESVETKVEQDGWCLVCVDGFTLGWGKLQKGRLKNKYFVGWKWE